MKAILGNFKSKCVTYRPIFISCMLLSVLIYSLLMVNGLVNPHDGLWNYSYHIAREWEISIGRWFWPYITALRYGLSVDPLTSIVALTCFCAGCMVILDVFGVQKTPVALLICGLFLGSAIICVSLSYRFMSPTFGLPFC